MGTRRPFVILLSEVKDEDETLIGGKAARLAELARAGFSVPGGFCLTIKAYNHFVTAMHLRNVIGMELARKNMTEMRWEEIWDASLRIRSAFTAAMVPEVIAADIGGAMKGFPATTEWAVRSTAPGEDSAQRSFAGLHESYLGVTGLKAVVEAVRLVWASLWSDAAMLYRRELNLDPSRSSMAVLLQPIRQEPVSGVAFGRDPLEPHANHALIEAVPGLCSGLVDGEVDPDRWKLLRSTGEVVHYQAGRRDEDTSHSPLLEPKQLHALNQTLSDIEALFSWPPDVEWTGQENGFTLLQARPITAPVADDPEDKRPWYLTLRPNSERLRKLCHRVSEELIPELETLGEQLAAEHLEDGSDEGLAAALEERTEAIQRWRKIYWDDFIPFAHGVRRLATFYNDAVRPEDPYEFVGLLRGEPLLALRRNAAIAELAEKAMLNLPIMEFLSGKLAKRPEDVVAWRAELMRDLGKLPEGEDFAEALERLLDEHLDLAFGADRLSERPDLILQSILELARAQGGSSEQPVVRKQSSVGELEKRLMDAVGSDRHEEAREVLNIGRISWRLRDNDNLLLARIEAQLLRAVHLAAERLRRVGRLAPEAVAGEKAVSALVEALRDSSIANVKLPVTQQSEQQASSDIASSGTPRQLIGQPASPGLQTGKVRRISSTEDLGSFKAGEILVCDGIQPMMTHLVPLAGAVVERRGGMLIHGAIIARELGIPCVNGVTGVMEVLQNGDIVTVDGFVGIVTVGSPDFDLELTGTNPGI